MHTALHYFDAGLGVAAFVGIFWCMYAQMTKSNAQRKLEQNAQRAAIQPWGNDKPGGRGNR
jgi:hypothetical protein